MRDKKKGRAGSLQIWIENSLTEIKYETGTGADSAGDTGYYIILKDDLIKGGWKVNYSRKPFSPFKLGDLQAPLSQLIGGLKAVVHPVYVWVRSKTD